MRSDGPRSWSWYIAVQPQRPHAVATEMPWAVTDVRLFALARASGGCESARCMNRSMNGFSRGFGRPHGLLGVGLAVMMCCVGGCRGGAEPTPTERLWISSLPSSPKSEITVFASIKASDGKYIGSFFHGSAFRGRHDVFELFPKDEHFAELRFSQDGKIKKLRFEPCEPARGFDFCLMMHGDPTGTVRYQSRKRWSLRRPGKRGLGASAWSAIEDLAQEDEALAAFTEPMKPAS